MICLYVLYSKCVASQNTNNLQSLSFQQLSICVLFLWGEDVSLEFGWFHNVCVFGGSAGKGGASENKSRQAAWEEDELREQVAISETHHTHTHSHSHTLRCSQTRRGSEEFIPLSCIYQPVCLEVLCDWLVFGLSQVWLKRCNRISRITTLKIIKSMLKKKKHFTLQSKQKEPRAWRLIQRSVEAW